jgi:penicillin-binding protein 2
VRLFRRFSAHRDIEPIMLGGARRAELRDHQKELRNFQVRLAVSAGVVLVVFLVLLVRLFYVQVLRHDHYYTLAENNRISIVPIIPNRGLILDRNSAVLAHNYAAYTLEITPSKAGALEPLIAELGQVVEIAPKDRKRFRKLLEEGHDFASLPIRTRLSDEEVARFAANKYRFAGVDIRARLFRHYPNGEIGSHVLGYIGRLTKSDMAALDKAGIAANYTGSDFIGKSGLEGRYERELHGTTGFEEVETDAGGRAVRTLRSTLPVSGNNLLLSLDARLQDVAERVFGDRRGALIAMEPATGGVLALVSKPGFDPNLFVDGIDPQNWQELNTSPDRPMVNRALAGTYPPGSTFKPLMALAALTLGRRTPQQAISDPGHFTFGNHVFRDDKVGGHGMVDMYKSIVVSCDTYYYVLANDLKIDAISAFMGMLGLGSRTGIDIAGEAAGVLPSRAWKQRRFRQEWYPGETISIGIGQGYNAYTPLQLAAVMATIANDGVMFRPHIVNYVEDIRTRDRAHIEPKPLRTLDVKPEHIAIIKEAMVGVNKEGTGARAFAGAEYVSGGKTGTAQIIAIKQGEKYVESRVAEHHRDHALFIAYAPAE